MSRAVTSRRRLIGMLGLAAAASALGACGPTPSQVVPAPPTATSAPKPAEAPKPTEAPAKPTEAPKPTEAAKPPVEARPTAAPAISPTAAAKPTQVAAVKKGGRFVDASFADGVSIQPLITQDSASSAYEGLVYTTLLSRNPDLSFRGELAKSYKVSDDKLSITYELKDDAVWSDGKPVTADDVKFTYDKMLDPSTKYPYASLWSYFDGVEVKGPKTVVFKLKEVYAPALEQSNLAPIPKHIFEKVDINENEFNSKPPIGSGPFLFKEWVKDDHATFVANDKYVRGRPNLDTYIVRIVKDETVSYSMLKTGEVDTSDILPQDYDEAKQNQTFSTFRYYYAYASWDYVGFNLRNPVLADKNLRIALSHGLDKQKMIDRVLLGFGKPQYSIYPSTSPVWTDEVPKFDYDPTKAKQLLDAAGWKPGSDGIRAKDGKKLQLRLGFNAGNKIREQIATVAQQYWKDLGVDVQIMAEEWNAYLKRVTQTHDFDLIILGWVGGSDPDGQSNIWGTGKGQNTIGYSNPKVDDLFKKGVTISYEMQDRKPVYVEVQKLIAEEQPYIFLWTRESIVGVNKRIKNIVPGALGIGWNLEQWYSETGQ